MPAALSGILVVLLEARSGAIGWRRVWWEFALVLLAGLGVVSVFWLDVIAYSATNGASMLG